MFFWKREGPYEFNKCTLRKGDFIIDAGSNVGIFSIVASGKIGKSGKIFGFEPVLKTYDIYNENLELNNIKNCKAYNLALGDKDKNVDIFIKEESRSSSIINDKNLLRKETIKQVSLDSFILENNLNKIDFIKADIEGAERLMIRGGIKTIKRFKPKISICVYHRPNDAKTIKKMLKDIVPEYNIVIKYKKLYAWV